MKSCNNVAARGTAQPADGNGKARRGGSGRKADEVLSLSSGIEKHDYDWYGTVDDIVTVNDPLSQTLQM